MQVLVALAVVAALVGVQGHHVPVFHAHPVMRFMGTPSGAIAAGPVAYRLHCSTHHGRALDAVTAIECAKMADEYGLDLEAGAWSPAARAGAASASSLEYAMDSIAVPAAAGGRAGLWTRLGAAAAPLNPAAARWAALAAPITAKAAISPASSSFEYAMDSEVPAVTSAPSTAALWARLAGVPLTKTVPSSAFEYAAMGSGIDATPEYAIVPAMRSPLAAAFGLPSKALTKAVPASGFEFALDSGPATWSDIATPVIKKSFGGFAPAAWAYKAGAIPTEHAMHIPAVARFAAVPVAFANHYPSMAGSVLSSF